MPRTPVFLAAALALAAAASAATAAPAPTYQLFTLDGYYSSDASDFCGGGVIAGSAMDNNGMTMGFKTDRQGQVQALAVPGATMTEVRACYQGQLMGETVVNGTLMGFYQDTGGAIQKVAPADGTFTSVQGMNAAGAVVGHYYPNEKGGSRASGFILQDGQFTRFDIPGSVDTRLAGILEDGTLIGNRKNGIPLRSAGFVLRNGVQTDIDVKGSYDTVVTGINAQGQVVGYFSTEIGAPYQGFVWANGRIAKFTMDKQANLYPLGIDDKGNVVGYISYPDYSHASFVGTLRAARR